MNKLTITTVFLGAAFLVAACGSSDTGDGGGSAGAAGAAGAAGSSGSGGSAGSASGSAKLGENCSKLDDCASSENTCIKVGGATVGFCTHSCTKAEDCPSSGWECNLSPYTACVPKK